jgi:hypothetical protein
VLTEPSLDECLGDDIDHLGEMLVHRVLRLMFHTRLNAAAAVILGQEASCQALAQASERSIPGRQIGLGAPRMSVLHDTEHPYSRHSGDCGGAADVT